MSLAADEGCTRKKGPGTQTAVPFHGYYFKILTRQGSSAPGGGYNYIINGNMIAGFALSGAMRKDFYTKTEQRNVATYRIFLGSSVLSCSI